jgi:hypothetical protein
MQQTIMDVLCQTHTVSATLPESPPWFHEHLIELSLPLWGWVVAGIGLYLIMAALGWIAWEVLQEHCTKVEQWYKDQAAPQPTKSIPSRPDPLLNRNRFPFNTVPTAHQHPSSTPPPPTENQSLAA